MPQSNQLSELMMKLLTQLVEIAPATQFILLTQAASHDQLAELDRPSV